MKLVSYRASGSTSFGVVRDDGVVDAAVLLEAKATSIRELLELGLVDELRRRVEGIGSAHALDEIEYLPPILDPAKIFCVGVNYKDHREETGTLELPEYPTIFTRFADSHVGHERPVVKPAISDQLDYEGEVAIVIGRHLTEVTSDADAWSAIAGLSCYNDVSVRDWQLHNSQWIPGKNFFGVGSFGPWIVTMDEFADPASVRLQTRINGEVLQDSTLGHLIFDFPAILRYITGFTPLAPGDVIATGTPGGVGLVADPPRFLSPGDVAEIEVSGVGVLRNTITEPGGCAK